jgi:hypothetical protein
MQIGWVALNYRGIQTQGQPKDPNNGSQFGSRLRKKLLFVDVFTGNLLHFYENYGLKNRDINLDKEIP